jgi:hypothetical protein
VSNGSAAPPPDLAWEGPVRPPAGSWQGISHVVLEILEPQPAPGQAAAKLKVFLFASPAGYGVQLSGPRDLETGPPVLSDHIELDLFELGGRGTYFVTLVPGVAPFPPLHPFFATASFNFTIDCEVGDCRPHEVSNPLAQPRETLPAVDLLTKDFDGFLQLLADRVRVQNPDWTDFAPASFERVLLELLAHHADMLSYYQDRVANEAFLDTASQRFSVRQHGVLLGYELSEGASASTLLSFRVAPPADQAISIPAKFAVSADRRPDEAPVVFSVTGDTLLFPSRNSENLRPAQWPDAFTATVPAGATSLLLLGSVTALELGQRLAFVQTGVPTQVRLLRRVELFTAPGWVASPNEPLNPFSSIEVTRIHWDGRLDFELRVWDRDTPDPSAPDPDDPAGRVALEIHANLVDARHGRWRRAQLTSSPTELNDANPHIRLTAQSAVITESPLGVSHLRALRLPEGPVLFDRAGEELVPAVELAIDDQVWFRQPHLHRSQPFDRHFVAVADNDGRLWLQFGDGRRGRPIELEPVQGEEPHLEPENARLKAGSSLQVAYRIGTPLAGNVDTGKLVVIAAQQVAENLDPGDIARIESVTNVTPGEGGKEPETLDAARFAIPASLRHPKLERAVTLEDYARLAEAADARVARAVARSLGEPFATVLVLVDVRDQAELDDELRQTLELALDRGRMVGREVRVRQAEDVPLDVELVVCVEPGLPKDDVKLAVLDALRPGSAEEPGFFHPNRLSFGQEVELGDLIAETQSVPGVLAVKATRFCRLRATPEVLQRLPLGSTEVARLDADELDPDNGRLVVKVPGLDDVPEGLFEFVSSDAAKGAVA